MSAQQNSKSWTNKLFTKSVAIRIALAMLVILGVVAVIFIWNQPMRPLDGEYVVNHDLFGAFGDFIGGIFGAVFTLGAVYVTCLTFHDQMETTSRMQEQEHNWKVDSDNKIKEQAEIERFNTLFFELNTLLRQMRSEMKDEVLLLPTGSSPAGTDFFSRCVKAVQALSMYKRIGYGRTFELTSRNYLKIYLLNAGLMAPYFRLLYRMFDLIEDSGIDDEERVRYAKIVRAQLSESELFLIRYNCTTVYGQNFIEYVNKYRLLKHLPVMELPEFCGLSLSIDQKDAVAKNSLNMLFATISKHFYDYCVKQEAWQGGKIEIVDDRIYKRYYLYLTGRSDNEASIVLRIRLREVNRHPFLRVFRNFEIEHFKNLLESIMVEIFNYSNFRNYNAGSMRVENSLRVSPNEWIVKCAVKKPAGDFLRLSHPSRDVRYGLGAFSQNPKEKLQREAKG